MLVLFSFTNHFWKVVVYMSYPHQGGCAEAAYEISVGDKAFP